MRVLFAASEAHPLVKTGGLGDVTGALPSALRRLGIDIRVLLPGYPSVLEHMRLISVAQGLHLLPGIRANLLNGLLPDNVPAYVLECNALFGRNGGPYQAPDGADWPDNAQRFAALSRIAAQIASARSPVSWRADLLHCNDWQTGLAPAYLKLSRTAPMTGGASSTMGDSTDAHTLFTIHNLAYAGMFEPTLTASLDLPPEGFAINGYEFHGRISFLKAGLYYADWLSTVSPSYAKEVQQPATAAGLEGLLTGRADRLTGILNGIDDTIWNPATDPEIVSRFDVNTLENKLHNKRALLQMLNLEFDESVPLAVVVSRLTTQKGLDLLPAALQMTEGRALQLVILGAGDPQLEQSLTQLEQTQPQHIRFIRRYDEALAHLMEAAADIFLMPSRFEPCGLNQMYSMRYGTPPVVHRTGGLADTVVDTTPQSLADGTATGFVFDVPDAVSFSAALCRALDLFPDKAQWRALQTAGMGKDFSWQRSAQEYHSLYRHLIDQPAT